MAAAAWSPFSLYLVPRRVAKALIERVRRTLISLALALIRALLPHDELSSLLYPAEGSEQMILPTRNVSRFGSLGRLQTAEVRRESSISQSYPLSPQGTTEDTWPPVRIVVFGSINIDLRADADGRWPDRDVTTVGNFSQSAGGKGANEAVALARLGMRPSLVGVVGADEHARWLLERFGSDGVDTSGVREMTHYADGRTAFTGTAVQVVMGTLQSGDQRKITVSCAEANAVVNHIDVSEAERHLLAGGPTRGFKRGGYVMGGRNVLGLKLPEEGLMVGGGSNPSGLDSCSGGCKRKQSILLLQLEIPIEPMQELVRRVAPHGVAVAFKPSPLPSEQRQQVLNAQKILDTGGVRAVFVNESEAPALLDWKHEPVLATLVLAERAAEEILNRWASVATVVVTSLVGHVLRERGGRGWLAASPELEMPGDHLSSTNDVVVNINDSGQTPDEHDSSAALDSDVSLRSASASARRTVTRAGLLVAGHAITAANRFASVAGLDTYRDRGRCEEGDLSLRRDSASVVTQPLAHAAAGVSYGMADVATSHEPIPDTAIADDLLVLPRCWSRVTGDAIGAADGFIGGFIGAQCLGLPKDVCLLWASAAATICTRSYGAQESLPTCEDIKAFIGAEMPQIGAEKASVGPTGGWGTSGAHGWSPCTSTQRSPAADDASAAAVASALPAGGAAAPDRGGASVGLPIALAVTSDPLDLYAIHLDALRGDLHLWRLLPSTAAPGPPNASQRFDSDDLTPLDCLDPAESELPPQTPSPASAKNRQSGSPNLADTCSSASEAPLRNDSPKGVRGAGGDLRTGHCDPHSHLRSRLEIRDGFGLTPLQRVVHCCALVKDEHYRPRFGAVLRQIFVAHELLSPGSAVAMLSLSTGSHVAQEGGAGKVTSGAPARVETVAHPIMRDDIAAIIAAHDVAFSQWAELRWMIDAAPGGGGSENRSYSGDMSESSLASVSTEIVPAFEGLDSPTASDRTTNGVTKEPRPCSQSWHLAIPAMGQANAPAVEHGLPTSTTTLGVTMGDIGENPRAWSPPCSPEDRVGRMVVLLLDRLAVPTAAASDSSGTGVGSTTGPASTTAVSSSAEVERESLIRLLDRAICPVLRGTAGSPALRSALLLARNKEDRSLLLSAARAGVDAIVRSLCTADASALYGGEAERTAALCHTDRHGKSALDLTVTHGVVRGAISPNHSECASLLLKHSQLILDVTSCAADDAGRQWVMELQSLCTTHRGPAGAVAGIVTGQRGTYRIRSEAASVNHGTSLVLAEDIKSAKPVALKRLKDKRKWEVEKEILELLAVAAERSGSEPFAPALLEAFELELPTVGRNTDCVGDPTHAEDKDDCGEGVHRAMGPTYGPYALVLEEGAPGGLSGECGRARAHGTNLQRRAEAERLVQCVNALHEVGTTGFVHCDIKPAHFLRFGASRRLVDFDSAVPAGVTARVGCTDGFAAPEVAEAVRDSRQIIVSPAIDVWALGLVLYELFTRKSLLDDETVAKLHAKLDAEQASEASQAAVRAAADPSALGLLGRPGGPEAVVAHFRSNPGGLLSSSEADLLKRMLVVNPEKRAKLSELLRRTFFHPKATAEMTQITLLGLFCCPRYLPDGVTPVPRLNLDSEMRQTVCALPWGERELYTAARFPQDLLTALGKGDSGTHGLCPRILHISGHTHAFSRRVDPLDGVCTPGLLVEDEDGKATILTADRFIPTLRESLAMCPRIQCLFLNCCNTFEIAKEVNRVWPELLIISWSTVTADKAAAAFATGFYTYLGQHCTSTARASKASLLEAYANAVRSFENAHFSWGDPKPDIIFDESLGRKVMKPRNPHVHGKYQLHGPVSRLASEIPNSLEAALQHGVVPQSESGL